MAFLFGKQKKGDEVRPWGDFKTLNSFSVTPLGNNVVIKKITVGPLKRLSYQSHNNRAEHWYIVEGVGKVTINDQIFDAIPGKSFDILIKDKHRIQNTQTSSNLVFIEISTGKFSEDDIVRYEDDFGRK